jgi:glycosyltransferase involved in cell wall biosynthesis
MWRGTVRVASVPSGHPYVRHLDDPDDAGGIERLPDPPVPGAPLGQWWPPPMLEADWVRRHVDSFDLLHIHFGFDDRTPAQLRDLAAALRAARKPLVVTVHDLRNPHHADPAAHAAALGVLVGAADQVVTLTNGAAAEIARRWGRAAIVIAHPHLVGLGRMRRRRPAHEGFVIGLHAKSERVSNDSVPVARTVARAARELPGAVLRIDVHDDRRGRAVAAELGGLDVRVHPRFSDDELWDYLSGLDLSVLPYRFGTHSGWLEACRDLGTTVLAPSCGYYRDQGPCVSYRHDERGLDTGSLAAGVRTAYEQRPDFGVSPSARRAQRREIARAHRGVYLAALGSP